MGLGGTVASPNPWDAVMLLTIPLVTTGSGKGCFSPVSSHGRPSSGIEPPAGVAVPSGGTVAVAPAAVATHRS